MGGRLLAVTVLGALVCGAGALCRAQDETPAASASPTPSAQPSPPPKFFDHEGEKPNRPPGERPFWKKGEDFEGLRAKWEHLPPEQREKFLEGLHRWQTMTPDQRAKFRENLQRWEKMTPEERKALRDEEEFRRQRMLREIDKSIQRSGLQLDEATREQYTQRYMEERRKIEEALQKEMQEKRRPLIEEMLNRLKEEFSTKSLPSTPVPTPVASPSAK